MPKYVKITPWNLSNERLSASNSKNYIKSQPVTFNLECILEIQEYHTIDDEIKLKKIVFGRGMFEYYLIEKEEADKIEDILFKSSDNNLQKEISVLTVAIRNLTDLLRFRLH